MGNARSVIKRLRFPLDIMLLCVRWYVAYALSLRNLEEMMQEGSVALRGARVKVGCTVSPQVSDPVGVNPPGCRIVALRTDLSRRRICPLRIMCGISSTPPRMIRAERKSLKPCIGRVMRLTARWSCSTMLLRYLCRRSNNRAPLRSHIEIALDILENLVDRLLDGFFVLPVQSTTHRDEVTRWI
jgi:hypothetical protein